METYFQYELHSFLVYLKLCTAFILYIFARILTVYSDSQVLTYFTPFTYTDTHAHFSPFVSFGSVRCAVLF